jgi:hypothetical protein
VEWSEDSIFHTSASIFSGVGAGSVILATGYPPDVVRDGLLVDFDASLTRQAGTFDFFFDSDLLERPLRHRLLIRRQ